MTLQKNPVSATLVWVLLALAFSMAASAQDTPRIQVFGGYSRLQFDSKSLGFSQDTGLNGWNGAAAFNLIPAFGVVAEAGENYGQNLRVRDWMIGPQGMYSRWKVLFFAHALFGKGDARVTTNLVTETQNGRAVALGGGLDYPITKRFSFRVQADYMTTHVFDTDQKNLRVSTGVVFRWGTIKKARRRL